MLLEFFVNSLTKNKALFSKKINPQNQMVKIHFKLFILICCLTYQLEITKVQFIPRVKNACKDSAKHHNIVPVSTPYFQDRVLNFNKWNYIWQKHVLGRIWAQVWSVLHVVRVLWNMAVCVQQHFAIQCFQEVKHTFYQGFAIGDSVTRRF